MKILKSRFLILAIIALLIVPILYSCKNNEEISHNYQDTYLFDGGITLGMSPREAKIATKKSGWFDKKLYTNARSVQRAKVKSAEFTYTPLPLSDGREIIPRISFDNKEDVILIGMNLPLKDIPESDIPRAFESYRREFMLKYLLNEEDMISSSKQDVKQIGEKSVFRTSTKLFYDKDVKNCRYWFDKEKKNGYAVYEISREDGYEMAFMKFKY